MSKKFKKFMFFTATIVAAGSALIYWEKKRKAGEKPLFEDEDSCNCTPDTSSKSVSTTPDNSRSYINLV